MDKQADRNTARHDPPDQISPDQTSLSSQFNLKKTRLGCSESESTVIERVKPYKGPLMTRPSADAIGAIFDASWIEARRRALVRTLACLRVHKDASSRFLQL